MSEKSEQSGNLRSSGKLHKLGRPGHTLHLRGKIFEKFHETKHFNVML